MDHRDNDFVLELMQSPTRGCSLPRNARCIIVLHSSSGEGKPQLKETHCI